MKKILFYLASLSLVLAIDAKHEYTHSYDERTKECKIFGAEPNKPMQQVFKGARKNAMDCLKQVERFHKSK